jgi:hypothetical protein
MCTLWQRFGRAGRNTALRGVAILFAEPKYFDADKEHKAALLEQKKRKAISDLEKGGRTKKIQQTQSAPEPGQAIIRTEQSAEPATREEEDVEGARALELLYNQLPDNSSSRRTRGGQKKKVIEPVMDDFINAKTRPHLRCFQKPVRIYFGNVGLSE